MNKTFLIITRTVIAVGLILTTNNLQAKSNYASYFKSLPFEMKTLKAPVFKNNTIRITDAGGVGDGETMNTDAPVLYVKNPNRFSRYV